MKESQKGFTLIELMIVVAIIGILAAVALPSYQDYVVKAKLSKVNGVIEPLKTELAAYYQEHGAFINEAGSSATPGAPAWTSLGVTNPTTTEEVSLIEMTACTNVCDGSTPAETNMFKLKMDKIKAGVIDTGIIYMKPVVNSAGGATAVRWENYCDNPATGTMSNVVLSYFKINGNGTACSGPH